MFTYPFVCEYLLVWHACVWRGVRADRQKARWGATLNRTASSFLGPWLAWPHILSDWLGPRPWESDRPAWAGRISGLHGGRAAGRVVEASERLDGCRGQIQIKLGREGGLLESDAWVHVQAPPLTGVSWTSPFLL